MLPLHHSPLIPENAACKEFKDSTHLLVSSHLYYKLFQEGVKY